MFYSYKLKWKCSNSSLTHLNTYSSHGTTTKITQKLHKILILLFILANPTSVIAISTEIIVEWKRLDRITCGLCCGDNLECYSSAALHFPLYSQESYWLRQTIRGLQASSVLPFFFLWENHLKGHFVLNAYWSFINKTINGIR